MYRVIIIFVLLAAIAGGLKYYERQLYKWGEKEAELNAKIALVEKNLEVALKEKEAFRVASQRLGRSLEQAVESKNELQRLYQEHDFTRLAAAKPGLIERRINDATQKLFDDLTEQSRADRMRDIREEDSN